MRRSRKGDVVEDGHRVEEGAFLKGHTEAAAKVSDLLRVEGAQVDAVDLDRALVRFQESDHVTQQHALACSRATEQHDGLRFAHVEIDAAQHVLRPEALVHSRAAGSWPSRRPAAWLRRFRGTHQKSTLVRKKSTMSTVMLPATTARVVDSPTPLAPPRVW